VARALPVIFWPWPDPLKRTIRFAHGLVPLVLAALALPNAVKAQRVEIAGRGNLVTDTIIERAVHSGQYTLVDADTVLPAADTLHGPILIAATTIKLENVIIGDVLIVDANVFMRPGSRITGDVINIAGALFRANTATIDGRVTEYKEVAYRAERTATGVKITAIRTSSLLDYDGLAGFHVPEYDRVGGLTVRFGAGYLLPRIGTSEPDVHAWIGYQTARKRALGGAEIAVRSGGLRVAAAAERDVVTNDAWARGRTNGISYLTRGHDYRDYYAVDRFRFGPTFSRSGEGSNLDLTVEARVEDAHSLPSLDPYNFRGNVPRPNPTIDDGRISSLVLRAQARWSRATFVSRVDAGVEKAGRVLGGDFSFASFDVGGDWAMLALSNHTFRIRWRLRGPLPGTDSLPRQRWNVLGGRATLYSLDEAELRGDRLVFVNTEYSVPLPRFTTIPILGRPALEGIHRVGRTWTQGGESRLIQNLGIRLRSRFAYIMYVVDPADSGSGRFLTGLSFLRRYPWSPD
jgi:hypothetical protein